MSSYLNDSMNMEELLGPSEASSTLPSHLSESQTQSSDPTQMSHSYLDMSLMLSNIDSGDAMPPTGDHFLGDSSSVFSQTGRLQQSLSPSECAASHDRFPLMAADCQRHIAVTEEDLDLPEMPHPHVQHIIASVKLATELDLRLIAISAKNTEYNPTKVNAVVMRLRSPKCTGLMFRSGRMMITGARSEEDAKLGAKKMAKVCARAGHPGVRFCGFKVESIVATADCRFPIRLEGLAHDHREFCSYEPELFAGLVYRYQPQEFAKAVLLIFVSGKVIITGCRNREDIVTTFATIYPVLAQYRK